MEVQGSKLGIVDDGPCGLDIGIVKSSHSISGALIEAPISRQAVRLWI